MSRPRVIVGMSGGVDSSVAAALLVQQGYQVQGVTLQVWEPEDESAAVSKRWQERSCCKIGIAKHVAKRLAIPYEIIDTRQTFRTSVIDDFLSGYLAGTTPNPCVRCNERVKLRSLIALAEERGADFVATGHYVQIGRDDTGLSLQRAADLRKDQSYFLYRLRPEWLPRLLFPVGGLQKADVWRLSESLDLPPDEIKESQEICFVTQGDYRAFIESEAPQAKMPGRFVGTDGRDLGAHDGIAFYTPGQRRGLGVSAGQRLYVQRVEPATNTVRLGADEDLLRSDCTVADLNVFDRSLLEQSRAAEVKVRYATPAAAAMLTPNPDGTLTVQFSVSQRALSPGQSAVFYEGDRVLGGGIIR
ncbi:MAG: tRNA 2-thiouridine(34) synthase MnmA [Nitrospira sp.]|nr:tRNA 2-thiouridine(34) synthase MnmA [Nitrospira sp.]